MIGSADGATLEPFGWSDRWAALFADAVRTLGAADAVPGRVVRHDGVAVVVATPRETEQIPVRGSVAAPAVGDWVVVDGGAVAALLPRSSLMRRRDPDTDAEQALAANVDVVAVVCGLDRPVREGRIHRSILLARDAGAAPMVVLTKADLADSADRVVAEVAAAHPGIEVLAVASPAGSGLEGLRAAIAGRTVVLVGESGAGKSTLTNALAGEEVAAVAEVRRGDAKGRHTTTARELYPLGSGAVIIDSPGIRAVGVRADADSVSAAFADVEALAAGCRFSDCAHESEPGCAVRGAVDEGVLPARRLEAWRSLSEEAAADERRAEARGRRPKGRRPRSTSGDLDEEGERG